MKNRIYLSLCTALLTTFLLQATATAAEKFITLASTTSTRDSGLFDFILPTFESRSGIKVRVIAVGTGQAIRMAKNGDADVLLVHHRKSEDAFVSEGYGTERRDVMYNDFVIIGPKSDSAGIKGMKDAVAALSKISSAKGIFLSRGDDSGTHKKERGLWTSAGVDTKAVSGTWYRETGSGMGATLNATSAMNGYTLADRGTWLSFRNKGELDVLVEGDKRILNPYGVILVDKKRHPHVKADLGQTFIDWLVSEEGQKAIAAFTINGKQLFKPNADGGAS